MHHIDLWQSWIHRAALHNKTPFQSLRQGCLTHTTKSNLFFLITAVCNKVCYNHQMKPYGYIILLYTQENSSSEGLCYFIILQEFRPNWFRPFRWTTVKIKVVRLDIKNIPLKIRNFNLQAAWKDRSTFLLNISANCAEMKEKLQSMVYLTQYKKDNCIKELCSEWASYCFQWEDKR